MSPSSDTADRFNWSRFNLQVALAVFALTAMAVVMFIAIHQFLAEVVAMDSLTTSSSAPVERWTGAAITHWIAGLLAIFRPQWVGWVFAVGGPLGAMVIAKKRLSALRMMGGAGIAEELDARLVEPAAPGQAHTVLCEQVGMACAARGMQPPPIYVLDLPETVTAATFGTTPTDAVLVFGSGAVVRLDPGALGALAAWQLTAFDAGRIERDARIAARLHPLTLPWLLGDRLLQVEDWLRVQYNAFTDSIESTPAGRVGNWPVPMYFALYNSLSLTVATLRRMLRVVAFPGLAMARLILQQGVRVDCAARDGEVGRDPLARDALAAVFDAAAQATDSDDDLGPEFMRARPFAAEFAHLFCTEPQAVPQGPRLRSLAQRLASHPDAAYRLARLAPQFDRAAYAQAAAGRAAQAALPGFAHGAASAMPAMALAPPVSDASVLAAAADAAAVAVAGGYRFPDPLEDMTRGEFFLRFNRDLLAQFDTPQRAGHVILAAGYAPPADAAVAAGFAARLKDVTPGMLAELRRSLDAGGKLGMRERRWVFERALTAMRQLPQEQRAIHLSNQRAAIEADRRITLEELFDGLMVARCLVGADGLDAATGAAVVEGAVGAPAAQPHDVMLLLAVVSQAGATDANAAAEAFARGRAATGMPAAIAPERAQLSASAIEQALVRLARADASLRATTVKACHAAGRVACVLHDGREELLRRLCAVLDCPVSMLRPAAAASSAAAAMATPSTKVEKAAVHHSAGARAGAVLNPQLEAALAAEANTGSVRVAAGDSDGLPVNLPCKICDGRMSLRRKLLSKSRILSDWALPALAALLAAALLANLCSDLHCGPVGWTMVIAVCAAVLFVCASIMDTTSPIAGMDMKRSTRIRWLYAFYAPAIVLHLFMGASFGVWVADVVTFGAILIYLLQSKPSGRNLFYQCSRCAATVPPPAGLVSGL